MKSWKKLFTVSILSLALVMFLWGLTGCTAFKGDTGATGPPGRYQPGDR